MAVMPFHTFCDKVLKGVFDMTVGQRTIAKVAFGDVDPVDLSGEEREIALSIFGGLERVSPAVKRYVVMMLGRGSGKTTMCAAFSVYTSVVHPFKVGPGDTPYVITIAPDTQTAKLSISMCREMMRRVPALERLIVGDEKTSITLRRPTGEQVKIEAFAASRGGSSVRGRTILSFLLDEACFFTSNGSDGGSSYAVSDTDIFNALTPRLVRGGKGLMISTPWPVETLMGKMFDDNWGKAKTALAIKAPTLVVRGNEPDVAANVEAERLRDPDNARREYDCELDGLGGEGFFDATALAGSTTRDLQLPGRHNPLWPTCAAADLGFKNDSSTLVISQFDGHKYHVVSMVELRPKPGAPLKPSAVIQRFAEEARKYGCTYIVSDGHYRESVKEHLQQHGLALVNAPEGMAGKQDSFSRVRSVLHEGLVLMPACDLTTRLIQQAKLVTAKPAPGGGLTIKTPRKAGLGHGDLVSAWVISIHQLAYSRPRVEKVSFEPNTPEWLAETTRRLNVYYDSLLKKSLKADEDEVKKRGKHKRRGR